MIVVLHNLLTRRELRAIVALGREEGVNGLRSVARVGGSMTASATGRRQAHDV